MSSKFLLIVAVTCIADLLFFAAFSSTSAAQDSRSAATKLSAPFTLAAVGDIREHQPIAQIAEPGFQNLIKLLREADVSFANMEGPIINSVRPVGNEARDYRSGLPQTVIGDLRAMGIRMVNNANNHTLSNGVSGMFSTMALLDEAGIVHAGSGKDLREARAPRFLSTSKGIVGLVGIFAIDENQLPESSRYSAATDSIGGVPGDPGPSGLHLKTYYIVTADQLQALRKIRDSVYYHGGAASANEPKDQLELFGTWYKAGPEPGGLSYTMDPNDVREILGNIRVGKAYADFMIATIHCHQLNSAPQKYGADRRLRDGKLESEVPDFLIDLAHQAIDSGADAFIAHGVHALRGVEIYKGKPIFYGISNFIFEESLFDDGQREDSRLATGGSSIAELTQSVTKHSKWSMNPWGQRPEIMEALLVTSRYEGGRLVEVRLNPADLGEDESRPVSRIGMPMTPSSEVARRIIEKLQILSKPFGTTISLEGNVGVIHVHGRT